MLPRPPASLFSSSTRLSSIVSHLTPPQLRPAPPLARMASSSQPAMPKFATSEVSKHNQPLGPKNYVKTAGCIIIGDEVLNGKTKDSNSNYFAQFCFNRGIELKRIEVIADDAEEIAEAVRRFGEKYDFTVTSGGIGPTFDDITYESIAKAFGAEPLEYHDETLRRMAEMQKGRSQSREQTEEMVTARKRMALFPSSKGSGAAGVEVIHPTESLWVPVVRINGRICILPGVPRLFEALLDGMEPYVPIDTSKPRPHRMLVHTKLPESSIAPYLEKLNARCKQENIRLGSYPKFQGGVDVSLIGDDLNRLQELGEEVEKELDAKIVASGKLGEKE